MDNSRLTSYSFTVQDDLVSQSSASTVARPGFFKMKPFSKDFGDKGLAGQHNSQEQPVPTLKRKIQEQAELDAYRELNEGLFNPFEHKLGNGFIKKESDLYEHEKHKRIQQIKRKELEEMNTAKNYTIVFKNNNNSSLQMAAKTILNEDACISDYYNKKFAKKMENITEEDNDDDDIKKDNFVKPHTVKKIDKSVKKESDNRSQRQISRAKKQPIPPKTKKDSLRDEVNNSNNKIVRSSNGWKKETEDENDTHEDQTSLRKINYPPMNAPKPNRNVNPVKKEPQQKNILQNVDRHKQNKSVRKNPPPGNKKPNKPNGNGNGNGTVNGKKKYSEVYDGPDRALVEQLEREMSECPNITFDDIAELDTAKNLLQEAVLLPRMMPEFFKGIRKAMKGILLFGPPGTGKTLLAKAVASNNMFFNVSASSLASKWKGESEKMVRLLFQIARYHSPSVIFFDEIDAIASRRSTDEHQSTRKVKTQLLVQMDGVGSSQQQVFVLAATNRPWDLDEALRRRLEKRIYIPLPGKVGRRQMFTINMKDLKVSESINWEKVIEATKGCSGADICNICRDAAYMPMRRKLQQVGGIQKISSINQGDLLAEELNDKDLLEAAKKIKPSVNQDDLKKYTDWMKEFGST